MGPLTRSACAHTIAAGPNVISRNQKLGGYSQSRSEFEQSQEELAQSREELSRVRSQLEHTEAQQEAVEQQFMKAIEDKQQQVASLEHQIKLLLQRIRGSRQEHIDPDQNSTIYGGGAAGRYAVFAGGRETGTDVAFHEMAHSFHGLADEYGGGGAYLGAEPLSVNVTTSSEGAKWAHWIGYEQPGIGTIGVYEGANRYDSDIFRPSPNSKMRTHTQPFDAVSREEIILDIYDYVDPLDSWLDNSTLLANPDILWVDVVDPTVIQVDWYLDGQLLLKNAGGSFMPGNLNLAPGSYEVSALAYDSTDWVRVQREDIQQLTTWQIVLTPSTRGDFTGDGLLTAADIDLRTAAARELRDEMLFDLNDDELVDQRDREIWVEEPAGTSFGDANLDRSVDFDDFVVLAADFGNEGGWAVGNFDLDTDVGFSDFVLLGANFGYSAPATAPLPEPAGSPYILS